MKTPTTKYMKNNRDGSNIKVCSLFQHSCNLTGNCPVISYYFRVSTEVIENLRHNHLLTKNVNNLNEKLI